MTETLQSILDSEARLISEAAEALPHQFNRCTYALGYIRQPVYLCFTCAQPRGICGACSIACHTDHEQVELFPKRHFRCDCPTTSLERDCNLHKTCELENSENVYGQNFRGNFCRCGRPYDAAKERETMIQCLACEDWLHESCLNLRERPPSREITPVPDSLGDDTNVSNNNDTASEASSSESPPLIADGDYDALICRSCVLNNSTLRRWAGTKGAMLVIKDQEGSPWTILNGSPEEDEAEVDIQSSTISVEGPSSSAIGAEVPTKYVGATGSKRSHDSVTPRTSSEEDRTKRPRTVESQLKMRSDSETKAYIPCLAPRQPEKAKLIIDMLSSDPMELSWGAGDVFLTEGWRSRWCRCNQCLPPLERVSYLLEEEETYEPPEDPESGFSLEELGMRALQNLPRDRAIDGIRAFNEMRDELLSYLRPFAEGGKVVNEADIRAFFAEKEELRRAER
ncbi:metaphase-anaphase transition [Pyrrhoderma noxium]|uniref:Metaphase-anaphase transition n=1 Tax=Pyrrhoderma noxium TaxID=2282107 RepID=A0A286UEJ2_9AGAM|nr:metaphase-anaphase transition [Pyrrhoderma noxium]